MKRQYQELADEIDKLGKSWQQELGLYWIDIMHVHVPDFKENDHLVVAETDTYSTWQYRNAKVAWYLASAIRLDQRELDDCIAHEYAHIMVAPIENKISSRDTNLCEFTVEGLARAFVLLRGNDKK